MKRATRQRVVMLAVAIALVALAGWQWRRDRDDAPGTLLKLPPSDITQVELRIGNGPAEHFSKREGHWWRVDGTAARADDGRLAELADTAAASVLSWRPLSDFDPTRIGLAPPVAVLSLDGQRLEFGETSVTGPQRYVRVNDRVALVSVRYTPRPATQEATKAR
ncbi:hypothetical protein CA260_19380 [Dyella jiangningensis]|uniref:DUF4340 domain-containing protein n=2 Tax=Dyella jiangningensis TaxID=1379159 RepID=A0A328NWF6_9GAMM|nr:hypothetical protein [Dyella jiangningensis]RAO74687.1 hypothetical protein CA260_19380 [Dyella jiangningensis]